MSLATTAFDEKTDGLEVTQQQPRIGAEVAGIDLREPLSAKQRENLRGLLLKYKVLFFRDQPLSRAAYSVRTAVRRT
jgi:alpha-ketoglutarate-dependent taurine dioxygenase